MGKQGTRPAAPALPKVMPKCALRKRSGMFLQAPYDRNTVAEPLCSMTYGNGYRRFTSRSMPRKSTTDRLQSLRQKREQLDAQLALLEARHKQAERKSDTRRKVIAGALALEHFEANPGSEFARVMMRLLDEYVVRPHDRVLFTCLAPADGEASEDLIEETFARAAREAGGAEPSSHD